MNDPNTYAPTVESVFGPKPWEENPVGMNLLSGATYHYNPWYFATRQTAEIVCRMVNGVKIVESHIAAFGPFTSSHPTLMVQLADGRQINAGLFASNWAHGYSQYWIDRLVESDLS